MRRLVRERCDLLMRLPMRGQVESLNAAVAGSVALYLALAARID
jgi:23S rRNA (guanosine2251-2'-O)-methyltransferase